MKVIPKILDQLYLRFGEIPENEKSGIYKGDMGRVGEEIGVSCYRGVVIDDKVYIIMPHIPSSTYYWLIDEYNRGKTPLYIIITKTFIEMFDLICAILGIIHSIIKWILAIIFLITCAIVLL